jgi:RNA recognition motif-containing protein
MENKLYVGNLPYSATDDSLRDSFAPYGTVVSASVITDRETGRSKGFGFVEMSTQQEAQDAIKALDGTDMEGRAIKVNIARPRTEDDRRTSRPRTRRTW